MIEHFEEDSCFCCEENLFNVSDTEDHRSPTTSVPVLKDIIQQLKTDSLRESTFGKVLVHQNWILKILREGYAVPFVKQPPRVRFQNNKSALFSAGFVTNEIKDLLKSGCIKEIDKSEAHVISPLSVVHKSTKPRLILDFSILTNF